MKLIQLTIMLFMALVLTSCFEEDQAVPPYIPPEDVEAVSIQNSIYTNQIYFDFSSGSIVAENKNSDWALAFECADSGMHIRVNSSNFLGLAQTGSTDISLDFSVKATYTWKSDKADGNPDSTAVGEWVSFVEGQPVYTREVMLLGKFDGISYLPEKKLQFISVDEASYIFLIGDPGMSDPDSVTVSKDDSFSYVYFSSNNNEIKQLEPPKNQWDVLFTQYFTILYTDDGIEAPYYVRGVWLNQNLVESALDTSTHFLDINARNALENEFALVQDAIGHDWKSVEVDEASNSAEYKVRDGYTYIIRDSDKDLYKFRFKSYFNQSGEKGYPSFEYSKL